MPSGTGISIKNPAARNNYHKTQQKVRYLDKDVLTCFG